MPDIDSVFGRMKEARLQTAVRLRETVSQERMAELISAEVGRVIHPTQWRRYETDREPPLEIIGAAARVSGLAEAYIAFGSPSAATGVALPDPTKDRRLTQQEIARAGRQVEVEQRAQAAPKPRKKRGSK